MTDEVSRNERIKEASDYLRGTLAEGLAEEITGAIVEDDQQLVKFHGMYLQDDRDLRSERTRKKMEKAFAFMIRVRIPGGVLNAGQWLALDQVARDYGNGSMRLTTRQTVQLHGIIKSNLKSTLKQIDAVLLNSIAACGDVNRNVMCGANPDQGQAHAAAIELARAMSDHLTPRTPAYREIWLDGEKIAGGEDDVVEPIYGKTYLPRKFKIVVAVPPSNDVDIFAHDLGYIAILDGKGGVAGWNVTVGGGMGMTHGEEDTYPRTADVMGFCATKDAVAIAEAVVTVQRDWSDGADGRSHLTLFVQNGRLLDNVHAKQLSALRQIAQSHNGDLRITPNQNLIVANIPAERRTEIHWIAKEAGLLAPWSGLRRNSMACVALPTCGLALAESERYLPDLMTALDASLAAHGLSADDIVIRMTGCPNGCARPYLAEIGLVGKGPGRYNLYLGAAFDGSRLSKLYADDVDHAGIIAALEPMFAAYASGRQNGERIGDFTIRAGFIAATGNGRDFHANTGAQRSA